MNKRNEKQHVIYTCNSAGVDEHGNQDLPCGYKIKIVRSAFCPNCGTYYHMFPGKSISGYIGHLFPEHAARLEQE